MYIQPYEPQEMSFASPSISGFGATPCSPEETPLATDGIASPWTDEIPGLNDAAGALNDAPFGGLGMGSMLANLTGMMQQLTQMMQALLGRMGGQNTGSQCGNGGCAQGSPVPRREELI